MALFLLLFASASTWLFQIGLSGRASAAEGSRRLAEATAQTTIARLLKQPDLNPTTLPRLNLQLASYPEGQGWLALDPTQATALGIPLSVNNLQGTANRPGWGSTVVAPQRACLVAVGRYRKTECRLEVMLHVPSFPYVVGSSVPLKAADGLKVFGVASRDALSGGFDAIPDDQKVPGHLVTNAQDSGSESALSLLGSSRVEGDAQARGNIVVAGSASVTGEVRPQAELAPLPHVDVTTLDTASKPGTSEITAATLNSPRLEGFFRRSGDLTINGGLDLQGAVIYVDGSITIAGGVKGKGAILATGSVTVRGGGSLTGDSDQAAILARGNVTLHGTPGQPSEFRGLIYSEGNLDSRHTRIAGSMVINNPNPSGTGYFEQVQLAETPDIDHFDIQVVSTVPGDPPGLEVAADFGYHAYSFGFETAANGNWPDIKLKWNQMDYQNPPAGYPVTHPPTAQEPWYEIGVPDPWPSDTIPLAMVRSGIVDSSGAIVGRWDEFRTLGEARAGVLEVLNSWPNPNQGNTAMVDDWLAEAQQRVRNQVPEYVSVYNRNARYLGENRIVINGNGTTTSRASWKLDWSEFFQLADRIRVLSWRPI
jgi:cytoskeletal protein CcmA (bactofilin family)